MDRPIHLEPMNAGAASGQDAMFAYAARNALRRKPETIRIGEATDPATIEAVTEAVRTGHLVSSTIHPMKGN
jgi:type II secretory ATPase GspE/PulE/Tfp pilus assembly ATPase PilB-like protein